MCKETGPRLRQMVQAPGHGAQGPAQRLDPSLGTSPGDSWATGRRRAAPGPRASLCYSAFKPCHAVIPPRPYYEGCVFDRCHMSELHVACAGLELYASLCAARGLCVDWRGQTNHTCRECPPPRSSRGGFPGGRKRADPRARAHWLQGGQEGLPGCRRPAGTPEGGLDITPGWSPPLRCGFSPLQPSPALLTRSTGPAAPPTPPTATGVTAPASSMCLPLPPIAPRAPRVASPCPGGHRGQADPLLPCRPLEDISPITEGCFCPEGMTLFSPDTEVCVHAGCPSTFPRRPWGSAVGEPSA